MTSFIEMFLLSKSECKKFRETYTDLFYHISRQNSRDLKRKLKEKIEIIKYESKYKQQVQNVCIFQSTSRYKDDNAKKATLALY